MSFINITPSLINDLKALVNRGVQDEFTDIQGIPAELKEALVEQLSTQRKAKYAQLANTLITLLTTAEQQKKLKIEKLREIRIAETKFLNDIKSLERSIDVAKETSNYLPLLVMLSPETSKFISKEDLEAINVSKKLVRTTVQRSTPARK